MNNVFIGVTTPLQNTAYTWNGYTYGTAAPLCSSTPITKEDYQQVSAMPLLFTCSALTSAQAIWILITAPPANIGGTGGCSSPGKLATPCGPGLAAPNACNVAFILDTVCTRPPLQP